VTGITSAALAVLKAYAWPGNVRELKNGVDRAVVVGAGPQLQVADLMLGREPPEEEAAVRRTLAEHERQYIRQVLEETGGVIKGPGGAADSRSGASPGRKAACRAGRIALGGGQPPPGAVHRPLNK
jgi:transcriptional regulator with GAF, ATPase, and Fis domain